MLIHLISDASNPWYEHCCFPLLLNDSDERKGNKVRESSKMRDIIGSDACEPGSDLTKLRQMPEIQAFFDERAFRPALRSDVVVYKNPMTIMNLAYVP